MDFESQKSFTQNLKKYKNLKYLNLAFHQLYCTKELFQTISEITNLIELKFKCHIKVPNVEGLVLNLNKVI